MNKSILFIINGFGMGNATRCESLIDILSQDYQIDVITSDKSYHFFLQNKKIGMLHQQMDSNLHIQSQYGSLKYYLFYIPYFFKRLINNYFFQDSLLKKKPYDLVLFDSDYSFILHRILNSRRHLIGLNNSIEVINYFIKNPLKLKPQVWMSFLIEIFDFLVYHSFLSYTICPILSFDKEKKCFWSKFLNCPLLVRKKIIDGFTNIAEDSILIMASSSNVESPLTQLLPQLQQFKTINLVGRFTQNNVSLLQNAKVIICNAGQSSIAECLYLQKKALVVEIPKHAEQLANSYLAEKKGLLRYQTENKNSNLSEIINSLLSKNSTKSTILMYSELESIIKEHFKTILNRLY